MPEVSKIGRQRPAPRYRARDKVADTKFSMMLPAPAKRLNAVVDNVW